MGRIMKNRFFDLNFGLTCRELKIQKCQLGLVGLQKFTLQINGCNSKLRTYTHPHGRLGLLRTSTRIAGIATRNATVNDCNRSSHTADRVFDSKTPLPKSTPDCSDWPRTPELPKLGNHSFNKKCRNFEHYTCVGQTCSTLPLFPAFLIQNGLEHHV